MPDGRQADLDIVRFEDMQAECGAHSELNPNHLVTLEQDIVTRTGRAWCEPPVGEPCDFGLRTESSP